MATKLNLDESYITQARDLVKHLELGNKDKAMAILSDLTQIHESHLFQEMGKLTRELHSILSGFRLDSRLAEIADVEIPDAKKRLNLVIEMTGNAAHKTLAAIEGSIPICEKIVNECTDMSSKWKKFIARDMEIEQFRQLVKEIGDFISNSEINSLELKQNLNDVVVAQDFQDLTGQSIKQVINLVQDIEDSLVSFIRESIESEKRTAEISSEMNKEKETGSETVKNQDEVDDLLSSLGF